jgi:flavin reductase (DIM6/NTAB) family NADH-FMN oxidoreductase RutF
MDERDLNAIDAGLRLVNRELWIVTAAAGERRGGLAATWVSSASIDREHPVMLAGIAPNHYTAELIDASATLGLHLLDVSQVALAMNFAIGSGRERDKLAGLELLNSQTGAPLLANCLAWFDCRAFARITTGDRIFYWADVLAAGQPGKGTPLCEQEFFATATAEEKAALMANRDADIKIQHPRWEAWRKSLPRELDCPWDAPF